jgi:hypothetical protein
LRFHQVYFVLDTEYRLLWIGGDWDEFALRNGGTAARSNEVLSTSLSEADRRRADQARRGRPDRGRARDAGAAAHRLPLRQPDDPAPLSADHPADEGFARVLLVHDLRDAHSFDRPIAPWQFDPAAPDCKCSFCCAVSLSDGPWTPAEALAERHPRAVRYTMCPDCEASVAEAVQSLRDKRKPRSPVTGGFGP